MNSHLSRMGPTPKRKQSAGCWICRQPSSRAAGPEDPAKQLPPLTEPRDLWLEDWLSPAFRVAVGTRPAQKASPKSQTKQPDPFPAQPLWFGFLPQNDPETENQTTKGHLASALFRGFQVLRCGASWPDRMLAETGVRRLPRRWPADGGMPGKAELWLSKIG